MSGDSSNAVFPSYAALGAARCARGLEFGVWDLELENPQSARVRRGFGGQAIRNEQRA